MAGSSLEYPAAAPRTRGVSIKRQRQHGRPRRQLGVVLAVALALAAVASIAAPSSQAIVFGKSVRLTGTVPTPEPGQRVDILARPYGATEYVLAATVSTVQGGTWHWLARPRVRTTYRAVWNDVPTSRVVVPVSPNLGLAVRKSGGFRVRARCGTSLAHRYVLLQLRRQGRPWRALRKLVLDDDATVVTQPRLPLGRSELRLHMPASQAGPACDAGTSAVLTFLNRA